MATSDDWFCELCKSKVTGKHYRTLTTKANADKYGSVLRSLGIQLKGKLCYACANKLNKITNLENDIVSKQEKCKRDVETIYDELRKKVGVVPESCMSATPSRTPLSKQGVKRPRTPKTPGLTPKSKKSLLFTPPKISSFKKPSVSNKPGTTRTVETQTDFQCDMKNYNDIGTQTKTNIEDFDVKVCVKYNGIERSRIITDVCEKDIAKCILNKGGASAIVKKLRKKEFSQEMIKAVIKMIGKELAEIVRTRTVVLKLFDVSDLLNFNQKAIIDNLQQTMPVMYQLLSSIVPNKQKKPTYLLIVFAVLMYARSQKINLLQFMIGLVLQKNGLSRQGVNILHNLGLSVSYTSLRNKRQNLVTEQEKKIESMVSAFKGSRITGQQNSTAAVEVLGDNLDLTVNPTKMTVDHQRQSLHWFIVLLKQRNVTFNDIHPDDRVLQTSIDDSTTPDWIPNNSLIKNLEADFKLQVSRIILKYIPQIKENIQNFPEFTSHNYLHLTGQKSKILNCDLIDESENSSQGMIRILQRVHELAVPQADDEVVQKVVFGGDVLTNERAFTAQEAMQNNQSDYDNLLGVTHRPEGLHREMNFLMGIYQLFYKESSAMDKGSLYQLRNLINRRDVTGGAKDVTSKFRPHHQFIEDVSDAYIVATFLDLFEMESEESLPNKLPVFSIMNDEQKESWLNATSGRVLETLGIQFSGLDELRGDLVSFSTDDEQLEAMKINDLYICALCPKQYRKLEWFKKHLMKKHNWKFHTENNEITPESAVKNFLLMCLLYRNTCEAFQTGDGDRLFRNCYFEWLYAASIKHTKYKIWLWRLITYVNNMLFPGESFEYKWNMSVNLHGGVKGNIPNDNCVELQVNNVKKLIERQGANKSFEASKQACMVTQVLDSIESQLMKSTSTVKQGKSRPLINKTKDISRMVKCLRDKGEVKDVQWASFSSFLNPLKCIPATELHTWINGQRKIAAMLLK